MCDGAACCLHAGRASPLVGGDSYHVVQHFMSWKICSAVYSDKCGSSVVALLKSVVIIRVCCMCTCVSLTGREAAKTQRHSTTSYLLNSRSEPHGVGSNGNVVWSF